MKVGVLISGRGSNLKALVKACAADDFPAEMTLVISNRPGAPGLDIARKHGIKALTIDHTQYRTREAFDEALDKALRDAQTDLICNAGFMRLLGHDFVKKWHDRQLNIHPSLLPAFKGLHAHQQALDAGVRISGCTVHFLRPEMDEGPIIAQAAVPVLPGDTPESLGARILKAEHRIYPQALRLVAENAVRASGKHIPASHAGKTGEKETAPLFVPPLD